MKLQSGRHKDFHLEEQVMKKQSSWLQKFPALNFHKTLQYTEKELSDSNKIYSNT